MKSKVYCPLKLRLLSGSWWPVDEMLKVSGD